MSGGDSEARTDTVTHLHGYPHRKPENGEDMIEDSYLEGLMEIAIVVGVVGLVPLPGRKILCGACG